MTHGSGAVHAKPTLYWIPLISTAKTLWLNTDIAAKSNQLNAPTIDRGERHRQRDTERELHGEGGKSLPADVKGVGPYII